MYYIYYVDQSTHEIRALFPSHVRDIKHFEFYFISIISVFYKIFTILYINNQDCVDNYGTGWIQTGWGGSCNEIQFQYRECTRSTSTQNSMLNDWIRNHPEPIQPQFIPISLGTITGNNINCCSQLFSNLSAGNALEISNINQQCQQKIISQIADVVQTNQTTLNNKTNTDVPTESEFDLFVSQNSTMLIIGILFLLLSCSCSRAFIVMS